VKKLSYILLAVLLLGIISPASASATSAPFVYMSGQKLSFTNQVTAHNGVTFIELRKVFELQGIKLTYFPESKEIIGEKKGFTFLTKVGSDIASINGEKIIMPAPSYAKNSRTMIPLRFLSEHLGLKVDWFKEIHSIIITGKPIHTDFTFTKDELNPDLLVQFKDGMLGNFPIGIVKQTDADYFKQLGAPSSVNDEDRYYTYGDYRLYFEIFRHGNIYITELRVNPKANEEINIKKVRETLGNPNKIFEDHKAGTTVYVWNGTEHSIQFHFIDANQLQYIQLK
jgi:hypothetical protein